MRIARFLQRQKPYRKIQKTYGNRSIMEEYKEMRREENTVHKRNRKEGMNVELENMELLRKQHECRKFYKRIRMARSNSSKGLYM
jgi:hypothetical protein